jgi:hypothetical protein
VCGARVVLCLFHCGPCLDGRQRFDQRLGADDGQPPGELAGPAVSVSPIAVRLTSSIGPVSMPSSSFMMVTPVSVSPRMIAHWTGAAPR